MSKKSPTLTIPPCILTSASTLTLVLAIHSLHLRPRSSLRILRHGLQVRHCPRARVYVCYLVFVCMVVYVRYLVFVCMVVYVRYLAPHTPR